MQPLLMLALYLIVAIVLLWLLALVMNAAKLTDPWRSIIFALMVLGIVVFLARQLGVL